MGEGENPPMPQKRSMKRALLREQLTRVRAIAERNRKATSGGAKDLHRIAQWLADQWTPENEKLLTP